MLQNIHTRRKKLYYEINENMNIKIFGILVNVSLGVNFQKFNKKVRIGERGIIKFVLIRGSTKFFR